MCGGGGRTFVLEVNKGSKSSKDERASLKVSSALRHRSRRSNLRRGSTLRVSGELCSSVGGVRGAVSMRKCTCDDSCSSAACCAFSCWPAAANRADDVGGGPLLA